MENRPVPGLGQIVHYRLSELDAVVINDRRARAELAALRPPHPVGPCGSPVAEGDLFPAVVVRSGPHPGAEINLQVVLDGTDQHWAQYVTEGTGPGTWAWPQS